MENKFNFKKKNRPFDQKLIRSEERVQELYNEIKNYLMRYKCKSRYQNKCETFRNRGIIARITLIGKTLKVYLALDPKPLIDTKYHILDASEIKKYNNVPTLLRVRSNRSLKYCKELIDMIMQSKNVKVKEDYDFVDFVSLIEFIEDEEIEEVEESKEIIEEVKEEPKGLSKIFGESKSISFKVRRISKKEQKKRQKALMEKDETNKKNIQKDSNKISAIYIRFKKENNE